MATRFVLSVECAVSDAFKQMYLKARPDDVVIIKSPGVCRDRPCATSLSDKIRSGCAPQPETCDGCLKECSREYCIIQALENSRMGRVDDGVVFCGKNVYKIKEILPVQKIFEKLLKEFGDEPD